MTAIHLHSFVWETI